MEIARNTILKIRTENWVWFFIISIYCCTLQTRPESIEKREQELMQFNKVKSVKIFQTEYLNGVAQPKFLYQINEFNTNGLMTNEMNYDNQGHLISAINYNYDKNENLILSSAKNADAGLIFRETRSYNKQNQRDELIFYLPDGTYKYRNKSTYNNNGQLEQLKWYWPEGLRAINKYDYKNGLKISDTEFDAKGKFNYKWIYAYDANGNQTSAIQYYPDSSVTAKIIRVYDKENQLVEKVDYMSNAVRKDSYYSYNEKNLIESITELSPNGAVALKCFYQFEFYK